MKSRILRDIIVITVFAVLAIPVWLTAQNQPAQGKRHVRYTVINLGTLGGSFAEANGISSRGDWVPGFSNLQGDQSWHATLWTKDKGLQDLGTLGGPTSSVDFPVKDNKGLIAGTSNTSNTDPFGEDFCSYGNTFICRGFLWQNGVMTPLPTLGGNNASAANVNSRGQVAGWAETTQDPNCIAPQIFDWEAFIWDPNDGKIHKLSPLPGDVVAGATAINEHGQVVGSSGPVCAQPPVALSISSRVVLWQNGSVIDLGSLGGVANNFPFAINNRGDVAGYSDLDGDTATHPFLWTKDKGMQDLGTLPGDTGGIAFGLNDQGQVVGGGDTDAFLWQDGVMTDLNTLVCPGTSLQLAWAADINERGEIVGQAYDPSTGDTPGFLAIPGCDGDNSETAYSAAQVGNLAPRIDLPENVRKLLQQRRGFGRFGSGMTRPQ